MYDVRMNVDECGELNMTGGANIKSRIHHSLFISAKERRGRGNLR